ncbi:MAG: UDP-N-acetylmuramoyl-tripeptide--D-alanyl-D-alanine ligase [Oscillospiraceae bacterium]
MRNLTVKNIIAACGGTYLGDAGVLDTEVSAVTSDSRALEPGCLFAAIPGERVDGHDYIAAALAGGALCAIAQRVPQGVSGNLILVRDTVAALQDVAAFYRQQFDIPVIGVTGSVGKTTAKEMAAAVLGQKYNVHKTAGNYNNELGVPLTIFGLREEHTAAVIEMGISHFGEMERLGRIVRPDYALYTIIGHAHLEFLEDRKGVLRAKTEMLPYLSGKGAVICNGDDDLLAGLDCGGLRKLSFGLGAENDLRAENIVPAADGGTVCDIVRGSRRVRAHIPAYGEHMVYAALEGAALGMELGLTDEEIRRGIGDYETVGHRARVLRTETITVIDDCYNANPTSTASAIRSLSRLEGRKVCILGDMLELGEDAARLHYEIGGLCGELGIDLVLTSGGLAREISRGAAGIARHFEEKAELMDALPGLIRRGDTVLVKASRSMRFEEITEILLKV